MKLKGLAVLIVVGLLPFAARGGGRAAAPATLQEATPEAEPAAPVIDDRARLFDYDPSVPLDVVEVGVEQRGDVANHDITYVALGRTIPAYLVVPAGEGPFAAVVFAHWFEPGNPTSNRTEFLDEAETLAGMGTVSLLVEQFFPWYEDPSSFVHDRNLVIQEVIGFRRALDLLTARPDVDPARIAFVGHDFGGMYGAIVTAVDKRIAATVIMAATTSFSDWFVPFWLAAAPPAQQEAYFQAMAEVDPIDYVGQAAPAALLFQFARDDRYVALATGLAFFNAASEPKEIAAYDAHHELDDAARQDRIAWLAAQMGLAAPEATPVAVAG